MTRNTARVIYPELHDPLTPGGLQQLFSPSFDERQWAPTVARTPASQVALLVQLKIFQTIGRFRRAADVLPAAIEHVARRMVEETTAAAESLREQAERLAQSVNLFKFAVETEPMTGGNSQVLAIR